MNIQTNFGDKLSFGNEEGAEADLVPWHTRARIRNDRAHD